MKKLIILLLTLSIALSTSFAQSPSSSTLQSAASSGNGTALATVGYSVVALSVLGTAGSDRVVTFEGSEDGTNYTALMCTNIQTLAQATTLTTSGTTVFQIRCSISGLRLFRTSLSGGATGTVTIKALALANVSGGSGGGVCVSEIDGSPSLCPWKIKFSNGAVTDNGDGTATVITGAGGGGDFSSNTATSVAGELVEFTDANGKIGGRSLFILAGPATTAKTYTFPNANSTVVTLDATQSLSNKALVAPALGTPASGVATNLTGTAAGLTSGTVTTNANLTGGVTSSGNIVTLQRSCQPGIGDGLNAIAAATYPIMGCLNSFGSTWTITAIKCYSDNNGTTTLDVKNGAGTSLLTAVITCTTTFAAGTQSATTTIASNDYIKITVVADGTSKNVFAAVTGTW